MRVSLVTVLTAALLVGACSDDSPTNPSTVTPVATAQLAPGNENPPVTNADQSGSGSVAIRLNVVRDSSQAITQATADFVVNLAGFPANTSLTGAHIHTGAVGVNGGIVVNTGIVTGDIVLANGSGSFTRTGINVSNDTAQSILNNPAAFYFNVHTTINTGGAARGQLALQ